MDSETRRLINVAVAWCGPVCLAGYAIFWGWLGHNIPPPNMMGLTPEQLIGEYYAKYRTEIEVGMIGTACFTARMLFCSKTCRTPADGSLQPLATGW